METQKKKETKKEERLKYSLQKAVMIIILLTLIIIITFGIDIYCDKWGDKYTLNSRCHDPNYRCTIECENYDWNFTGKIDGFMCDCGEAYVSVCSGFAYPKDEWI